MAVRWLIAITMLGLSAEARAEADKVVPGVNVIVGGIHWEHRFFQISSSHAYATVDLQAAPWFYDEPELPKGWWARNFELHFGYRWFESIPIMFGLGMGVTELALTSPRGPGDMSGEDEKAGFFGPEVGFGLATPVGSFSLVGVAHVTKDLKVRGGADLHLIVPVGNIVSFYSTLGYARLENSGEQTSGFSVLVGVSPSFLYAKK